MTTAWLELSFKVPADKAETFEEWLTVTGADAITLRDAADQPIYEPDPEKIELWQDTEVVALYPSNCDIDEILAILQQLCNPEPLPTYQIHHLGNEDWERKWLEFIEPMQLGEHFWISPPALTDQISDPDAQILLLEPGLAFGTGTHHTTRLCLEALQQQQEIFNGKLIIDYGCGSGILGLTALKLGAKHIVAVDISQQALESTQQNAALNDYSNTELTILTPAELKIDTPVDFLVANILANPLIELCDEFAKLVAANGVIILSGILAEDSQRVESAYQQHFTLTDKQQSDEWVCLSYTRSL